MLHKFRTSAIAALLIASTAAAPASAWGQREQDMLKGAAAAAAVGYLLMNSRAKAQQPARSQTGYYQPQTSYRQPQTSYRQPQSSYYPQPSYQQPARYEQPSYGSSDVYSTPAARAFNSYPLSDRRRIQARLSEWGYYNGGIDGSFGPMTYRAVTAFAGDSQGTTELTTVAGAYDFYGRLLR
ncbi:peptidoglycan-binding protein [Defluviimonas sp. WL0024]|uniref:Peptidoglycan-binding protein n=2 Tax=Albidovulum TaxID=205889 RepID=A0ABT3J1U7_9RHOB|nr:MULTISPECIES: peptidoglycan-binding protein [Defluviimonas]MCU9847465.1 peptidoglycan-binding protein [Defluviimonas sp. WL0024]MCW3781657.1 peptidoglycan-binding protein [Defluviimonas salinarum]